MADLRPRATWTGVSLEAALTRFARPAGSLGLSISAALRFVSEPKINAWIVLPELKLLAEGFAPISIVFQRPGTRDFEPVVVLMEIAHGGAVTELGLQVVLDPTVELHGGPVALSGQRGIFDERQDRFAYLLLRQDASATATTARNEAVKTGKIEGLDKA